MKNFTKFLFFGLIVIFFMAGCAKQPAQEIEAAKAAIEVAESEGADIYAPEELKKLNDDYAAAMDEVKTQEGKVLKKFKEAKEMLAAVQADAEALKATIPMRIEEAKNAAIAAQTEAQAALEEAKALLEKAPRGKGTRADIEAFKADLKGLEDSMPEIQAAIDNQDYLGAKDKAVAIKDKAVSVSDQINQAIEKVKKR